MDIVELNKANDPLGYRREKSKIAVFILASLFAGMALFNAVPLNTLHMLFSLILVLCLLASLSRNNITLMLYFSTMMLYWVIAPIIQKYTGVHFYQNALNIPRFTLNAFVFFVVHAVGLFLGLFLVRPASLPKSIPLEKGAGIEVIFPIVISVVLIFIAGPYKVLLPRLIQPDVMSSYDLFMFLVIKMVPAFICIYWISSNNVLRRRWYLSPVFLFLICFQILVANPVNTGRFISLSGLFLVIIFLLLKRQKAGLLLWLPISVPIVGLVLLPATSVLRGGISNFSFSSIFLSFSRLEFSAYSIFIDALKIHHFPSGNYTISHLLIFVPSRIWATKAGSIGVFVADKSGYIFDNVGLMSFFNAYADYGYVGLFLLSLCFGVACKKLNPLRRCVSFKDRRFMYSIMLFSSVPIIFRGDMSTAMIALYASTIAYEMVRLLTVKKVYLYVSR